jgi:hypothetical protein
VPLEGIDLDHPSELRGVRGYRQPGPTTNVHSHITQEWDNFIKKYPDASASRSCTFVIISIGVMDSLIGSHKRGPSERGEKWTGNCFLYSQVRYAHYT